MSRIFGSPYDNPVQISYRSAAEDVEIGGKLIRKGQLVNSVLAAGNRDPERFSLLYALLVRIAWTPQLAGRCLIVLLVLAAAVALAGPLILGGAWTDWVYRSLVLLVISAFVAILTVVPGRAKPLQGGVHLVLLAAFLFLTIAP